MNTFRNTILKEAQDHNEALLLSVSFKTSHGGASADLGNVRDPTDLSPTMGIRWLRIQLTLPAVHGTGLRRIKDDAINSANESV